MTSHSPNGLTACLLFTTAFDLERRTFVPSPTPPNTKVVQVKIKKCVHPKRVGEWSKKGKIDGIYRGN